MVSLLQPQKYVCDFQQGAKNVHDYELTRTIQQSILNGKKSAKAVSQAIGKPYSTMLREANPYDTSAKVGVETLLAIMRVTGDVSPLHYMARALGLELFPAEEKRAAEYSAQPSLSM